MKRSGQPSRLFRRSANACRWLVSIIISGLVCIPFGFAGEPNNSSEDLLIVVMDPLSDKLACDCVEGYAQRKYQHLGSWLQDRLDAKVTVTWGESITAALEDHPDRTLDIVIGKHSVVLAEARKKHLKLVPIASLTGKDGVTTQTGLVVVRAADPASSLEDLTDYRIFYGPADCDEKFLAPQKMLKKAGLEIHNQPETCGACSEAAVKMLELPSDEKAAAIISSYAAPLLEGCGAVEKGQLRVLAESDPVPFITVFANSKAVFPDRIKRIQTLLLDIDGDPDLLKALETKSGFIPFEQPGQQSKKTPDAGPEIRPAVVPTDSKKK